VKDALAQQANSDEIKQSSTSWFLEMYEVCKPKMKKWGGGGCFKLTSALAQEEGWGFFTNRGS
jgi:hypothetical protein